jgi:hypothetical protein
MMLETVDDLIFTVKICGNNKSQRMQTSTFILDFTQKILLIFSNIQRHGNIGL